ncbi:uncharacterized protein [Epargyreus clarus]|uniref:uncharacterized protein isoform X2 n=1 Tax=Epargyreus clarus TaxID=520877 RepID=UPI003C3033B1
MTRSPDILFIAEYIKNVLYFATVRPGKVLKDSTEAHYFTIDDELIYENYYSDFGPLNLGCVYKYCTILDEKLKVYLKRQIVIVHYTTIDPKKKANAAFLLGCYGIIYLSLPPKDAIKPLLIQGQNYRPFQDATQGDSSYTITLLDCMQAIAKARDIGFFNFQDFNYDEYEKLDKIQGGDLNWIVPGKFLAFIGPVDYSVNLYHPPEMYIKYFKDNGVQIVIRLNKRLYDSSVFSNADITHYDLFFPDGSCPPRHILIKFLQISEESEGAIAVHCKAGLGRTGSLIGCYLIKHYRMTAREAIGWMRICRPGSVIGQQQGWLEHLEAWLLKQGNMYRKRKYHDIDRLPKHQFGVYSISEKTIRQAPITFSKSSSPPPPIHRQTRSDISPTLRPNASKTREAHKPQAKKEQFEWRVTSPQINYRQKIQEQGNLNGSSSIVSRRSGAGEPRAARSPVRGHSARSQQQRENLKPKEPSNDNLRYHYPIPTFVTTHGPVIKTVNDAKNFLMKSSMYNEERRRHLNSSVTVTPQYTSRITNFRTEKTAPDDISRFTPSYYSTGPTQPNQRRRLGRSPSPPPSKVVTEQSRATNTPVGKPVAKPVGKPVGKYQAKDSNTALKEALSCLKIVSYLVSSPRDGSIGAASLGARREAPAPQRAPSIRSDERPLATQGDMLNSIKFQRRLRDTLQGEKFTTLYHDNKNSTTREKSSVRTVNSKTSSATKQRVIPDFSTPREKASNMNQPKSFLRTNRPSSPKGRRNMQPSFY